MVPVHDFLYFVEKRKMSNNYWGSMRTFNYDYFYYNFFTPKYNFASLCEKDLVYPTIYFDFMYGNLADINTSHCDCN